MTSFGSQYQHEEAYCLQKEEAYRKMRKNLNCRCKIYILLENNKRHTLHNPIYFH